MKKSFKSKHLEKIVSVFLFIAIFLVSTMVIFLAKQKKIFAKKINYYTIINSAEKINTGQEIILRGPNIPIGKITNISIDDNPRASKKIPKVRIDFFIYEELIKDEKVRIRTDSVIIFSAPLFGLLGGYKVEITQGSNYYPKVKENELIPSNQMKEGEFLLSVNKVKIDKDDLPFIRKIDPLLENITKVLDPNGRFMKNVNRLVLNLSNFSLQLSEGGVINVIGDPTFRSNLRKALSQVNRILYTSDNLMSNKVKDVLSQTYLLLNSLKKTTDTINYNMPKTLERLNSIMFSLARMIRNLEKSPIFRGGGYIRKNQKSSSDIFKRGP